MNIAAAQTQLDQARKLLFQLRSLLYEEPRSSNFQISLATAIICSATVVFILFFKDRSYYAIGFFSVTSGLFAISHCVNELRWIRAVQALNGKQRRIIEALLLAVESDIQEQIMQSSTLTGQNNDNVPSA